MRARTPTCGQTGGDHDFGTAAAGYRSTPGVSAQRASRALATAGAKRSPLLPELPTLIESGVRVDTSGWYGFVGPARLPATRVAPLHRALLKTLASTEVRERFAAQGIDSIGSTPEAFSAFLREEIGKWRKVIDTAGLKGD
jgi:tripartite-type tricarboxylate transporter receptor subunit TctC